jgi:hypothetical protein
LLKLRQSWSHAVEILIFYISLTVHLSVILANNQLDALFFPMYLFISLLYMFRATQCSSLGESNFINTSYGI